jgi:hypothetical protein
VKKIMALCDGEQDYLYHMADYLERKDTFPFAVHCFTDAGQLRNFMESNEVELLLVAENAYEEGLAQLSTGHTVVLNESGNEVGSQVENINKYQATEFILKAVMDSYMGSSDKVPKRLATGNRMKVIGCYSPIRRSFQTTFSLSMGQILARKHKVLYLNFESYSGFGYMLHQEYTVDITDALYFFNCEREKLAYKLEGLIQSINGLDYIPPAVSYRELRGVTGEEWLRFIQEIEKISEYEFLILDLSEHVQGLFEVLRECHCIFTMQREDGMAEAKMRQYEMLLQSMEYADIAGKTKKWKPPVLRRLPPGIDQLARGEMAVCIKKIIEEEIYGEARDAGEGNKR